MPKVVPEYRAQAKKKILKAATAEFAKRGYRATTMNDIAKRLKVSKGAIYRYYPSKEDLLRELAGAFIGSIVGDASLPLERDLMEPEAGYFVSVVNAAPDWAFALVMEMYAESRYNPALKQVLTELEEYHLQKLCEFLENRKQKGEFNSDLDLRGIADVCLALETGLMAKLSAGVPREEVNKTWKGFIDGSAIILNRTKKS